MVDDSFLRTLPDWLEQLSANMQGQQSLQSRGCHMRISKYPQLNITTGMIHGGKLSSINHVYLLEFLLSFIDKKELEIKGVCNETWFDCDDIGNSDTRTRNC